MVIGLIIVLIILMVLIFLTMKRRHRRQIFNNIYLRLIAIFLLLFLIGTLGMYLFEKDVNPSFATLYQSFWSSMVFLLSGYEDRIPITFPGQVMSLLIFIASFGILGSVAGNFANIFMKHSEVKMPKNIKDHIVICNWNKKGEMIINELHSSVAVPGTPIIVISEELPCNEVEDELRRTYDSYENVEFRKADPNLHQVLEKANIATARSIIILADRNSPDPDAESVLTAIAVNSILKKRLDSSVSEKPYMVAEAIDSQKVAHLQDAGVDEIICSVDYGISLLSQCAIYPKLSEVYTRLLTYSDDTNEIYVIRNERISNFINGKSFQEVSKALVELRDEENPVILIGVKRGNSVILNPKKDHSGQSLILEKSDGLIVISYKNPDFNRIFSTL